MLLFLLLDYFDKTIKKHNIHSLLACHSKVTLTTINLNIVHLTKIIVAIVLSTLKHYYNITVIVYTLSIYDVLN